MTTIAWLATILTALPATSLPAQQDADDFSVAERFGEDIEADEAEDAEEEDDELESDRDSFTRSPRLMAPGRTMVEASYTFLDNPGGDNGHLYPDLLVRYGVSELMELRVGWSYEDAKLSQLVPLGAEPEEEGILNYGAKLRVTRRCDWRPDSALVVTGYTPTSDVSNDSDLSLEYIYGWESGPWQLDGMVRWFSLAEEEDHFTEWAPSLVLKRNVLCNRANVHVEYFSQHSGDREEDYDLYFFGPGAHYLVTPNLEVGARVFWGLSEQSADFIVNSGVAARF